MQSPLPGTFFLYNFLLFSIMRIDFKNAEDEIICVA